MPVIINDFDVAMEPSRQMAAPPAATQTPADGSAPAAGLQVEDLERLLAFFEQRRGRLVAD